MISAKVNGKQSYEISFDAGKVLLNGEEKEIDSHFLSEDHIHVTYGGKSFNVFVEEIKREEKQVLLNIEGKRTTVELTTELDLLLKKMGLGDATAKKVSAIKAPMPGLIHSIAVAVGDEVKKGDVVLILEAMKMENVLKSPADGVVSKVAVESGQSVEKNQLLIGF